MAFTFERLVVYQKSVDIADALILASKEFPRGFGFLSDQLCRASLSIAANIAEGNGRFTKKERKHFFGIARGSLQECIPLLEIANRRGFINASQLSKFRNELEAIAKMISGLIQRQDAPPKQ